MLFLGRECNVILITFLLLLNSSSSLVSSWEWWGRGLQITEEQPTLNKQLLVPRQWIRICISLPASGAAPVYSGSWRVKLATRSRSPQQLGLSPTSAEIRGFSVYLPADGCLWKPRCILGGLKGSEVQCGHFPCRILSTIELAFFGSGVWHCLKDQLRVAMSLRMDEVCGFWWNRRDERYKQRGTEERRREEGRMDDKRKKREKGGEGGWRGPLKGGCQKDPRDVERRHNHNIMKNQVGLMEARLTYIVGEAHYCITRGIEPCIDIAR